MPRPFLVAEDVEGAAPRRLFNLFGVDWLATRFAWLGPFFFTGLGLAVALLGAGRLSPGALGPGVVYGLLLWLSNTVHTLGHVLAARLAGTPMDANVLTATRDVNVYRGAKREVATAVRVGRALGGPAANAVLGCSCLALWQVGGGEWLRMGGIFNLAVAAWTLMPVPTLDGWIVWGALAGRLRRSRR